DGIRAFHVTGVQTCALPISTSGQNTATYTNHYPNFPHVPFLPHSPPPPPPKSVTTSSLVFTLKTLKSTSAASIAPTFASSPVPKIGRASCRETVHHPRDPYI